MFIYMSEFTGIMSFWRRIRTGLLMFETQ